MVAHVSSLDTLEVKTGRSEVHSHLWLYSKSWAILGYMRPCPPQFFKTYFFCVLCFSLFVCLPLSSSICLNSHLTRSPLLRKETEWSLLLLSISLSWLISKSWPAPICHPVHTDPPHCNGCKGFCFSGLGRAVNYFLQIVPFSSSPMFLLLENIWTLSPLLLLACSEHACSLNLSILKLSENCPIS